MCIRDRGKTVLQAGWKEIERLYRMGLKQAELEKEDPAAVSYTHLDVYKRQAMIP